MSGGGGTRAEGSLKGGGGGAGGHRRHCGRGAEEQEGGFACMHLSACVQGRARVRDNRSVVSQVREAGVGSERGSPRAWHQPEHRTKMTQMKVLWEP